MNGSARGVLDQDSTVSFSPRDLSVARYITREHRVCTVQSGMAPSYRSFTCWFREPRRMLRRCLCNGSDAGGAATCYGGARWRRATSSSGRTNAGSAAGEVGQQCCDALLAKGA